VPPDKTLIPVISPTVVEIVNSKPLPRPFMDDEATLKILPIL